MKKIVLIITIVLLSNKVYTQGTPQDTIKIDSIKTFDLEEINIKKKKQEPQITKVKIKNMDLPQSITVIENETIKQQQAIRLSEVIKNANGVYVSGASNAAGSTQEELGARGFSFSGANTFKNGVRFNSSIISDISALEYLEILKGSSAILFGNVSAGAILNLVTKKPKFEKGGEISFQVGEFNSYKPIIDVYGAINDSKKIAFRAITTYEKSESFRDEVKSERYYIAPSILYNISEKTKLLIETDYLKSIQTPDFGLPVIDYKVVELSRNAFLGLNWGYYKAQQVSATATLTHEINKDWNITALYSYQGYNTDLFTNTRPNSGVTSLSSMPNNRILANGNWTRGVQQTMVNQDYNILEADLTGKFKTGKINHTFLFGTDADITHTGTLAYKNIVDFNTINIYNPSVILNTNSSYTSAEVPTMTKSTNTMEGTKRMGIYVQDLIEFTPKIKLLTGLRYSHIGRDTEVYDFPSNTNIKTNLKDNILSPKAGLIIQPTKNHSVFMTYSNSFILNTGTTMDLKPLSASNLNQYELGIKNNFLNNLLTINATTYFIDYNNVAQTDISNGNTNTNIKTLNGSQSSVGFELDVTAKYKDFNILAGYSFNETKVTKSSTLIEGQLIRFTPNHTANASIFYTFNHNLLKGLQLGLMANYIGDRFGGRGLLQNPANEYERIRELIPAEAFIQLDASIGYSIKNFAVKFKVLNIGNVYNYYVYDDNTVTPIAPRNFVMTFNYTF